MTLSLYIDPGAHKHACAYFLHETLVGVAMTEPEKFMLGPPGSCTLEHLVIEKMVIYNRPGEEDPNDLITVHGKAEAAEFALRMRGAPPALWVEARNWKGQVKKPFHHRRVWETITAQEKAILATAIGYSIPQIGQKIEDACKYLVIHGKVRKYSWEAHNLLDAIGLGLWHTKRVGRAGHRYPSSQS